MIITGCLNCNRPEYEKFTSVSSGSMPVDWPTCSKSGEVKVGYLLSKCRYCGKLTNNENGIGDCM